jgi:phospholipase C
MRKLRKAGKLGIAAITLGTTAVMTAVGSGAIGSASPGDPSPGSSAATATTTPIKHLVVIFQENVSFDHYFGTYPNATNPSGEPSFTGKAGTPSVNGLTPTLLTANPNTANPTRLDRSQAITCDQGHDYTAEQRAFDHGLMDRFVQETGNGSQGCDPAQVMDYYDGNTVTGLWNYAQNFAMSDNSYSTGFGPSTPGALNLVSGQTHGATPAALTGETANGTVIGDPDPTGDDCSGTTTATMSGTNVGDLLNAKGVTWGWFQGGFKPSGQTGGKAVCGAAHTNVGGASVTDYSAHHEPFQYYAQTANPHHLPPTSAAAVGTTDQAKHQYDLSDFSAAADSGHLPAMSFLKASKYQDGHPGYSDPIDEQHFLVDTINHLQKLDSWKSTAVLVAYDDSDGWYDHVMGPIVSQSSDPTGDALTDPGKCGTAPAGAYQDRCGYGPRQPLLAISPWAKSNFVDHSVTDQSSILRFAEDNWGLGRIGNQSLDAKAGSLANLFDFSERGDGRRVILDPSTGQPTSGESQ